METNDVVKELGTKITIPKGIKLVIFDKMFKICVWLFWFYCISFLSIWVTLN